MKNVQIHHTLTRDHGPKWFNTPVVEYSGKLSEMAALVPEFERRSFGLMEMESDRTRLNSHLDVIVRKPAKDDPYFLPVGVVSKGYALVTHREVVDTVVNALQEKGLSPADAHARMELSEYGERMALSVFLPEEYNCDPGDGHPLSLRLECRNSVDGSTRFRVFMGWFRFICSNGLTIGVTRCDLHRRHVGDMALPQISHVLSTGIGEVENEKKNFTGWYKRSVKKDRLRKWVNGDVRKTLGFKAAARSWHIANTGWDVEIVGPYRDHTPTNIRVEYGASVPGAPEKSRNLYDISQVLAWLARDRRDLQEQLEWREGIPGLMGVLVGG